MKKLFVLIAVLICSQCCFAQYFPDTAWTRCYGGTLGDEGVYIQQTFDGGYIVLGKSNSMDGDLVSPPAGWKQWIFKIDSIGNIEWQKFYNYSDVKNIRQTSDGGYIIGGPKFTKLKPNGDIDWQVNIPSHWVVQTADGGYGLFNNVATVFFPSTLTKLSPVATTEWVCQFDQYVCLSILATNNNEILISGYRFNFGPSIDIPKFYKIGPTGNYVTGGSGQLGRYNSTKPTLDEKFIVVGSDNEWNGPYYSVLQKMSTAQEWALPLYDKTPLDVLQNIDSTYVLCGLDTFHNAFISKTTSTGIQIATVSFGGSDGYEQLKIMIPTEDSGYIAIGSSTSINGDVWGNHGGGDIWIVKFKQDTSVHAPQPVLSIKQASKIDEVKVYPTLSNGIVHVSLPEGYEGAEIGVFDIVGREMEVKNSGTGGRRSIDISEQPAGQYILTVRMEGERRSFRVTNTP